VVGGQVEGPDQFEFALGDQVEITVLTDVADEIHIHGYDLRYDAEPGVPVEISFEAEAPGVFEVELEASHLPLFDLEVTP
jgi:heme/copper-type cytochrome/quinol oxidase subunit 2